MAGHVNRAAWRALRQANGLSFRALASRVESDTGMVVSYAHLANIEAGRRGPSEQLVDAVALALNVPAAALVHQTRPVPHHVDAGPVAAREDKSTSSAPHRRGTEGGGQRERSHVGRV